MIDKINCAVCWIVIYPVDSAIYLSNILDQMREIHIGYVSRQSVSLTDGSKKGYNGSSGPYRIAPECPLLYSVGKIKILFLSSGHSSQMPSALTLVLFKGVQCF